MICLLFTFPMEEQAEENSLLQATYVSHYRFIVIRVYVWKAIFSTRDGLRPLNIQDIKQYYGIIVYRFTRVEHRNRQLLVSWAR